MALWMNIPLVLILMCLLSSAICSILPGKAARIWMLSAISVQVALSLTLLLSLISYGGSFVYKLSEVGAPYGNELSASVLEAMVGLTFTSIMLLSVLGGWRKIRADVHPRRMSLYCVMVMLLLAALNALTYTNDLFTGYVFIEIATISACALILVNNKGRSLFAATRYMLMNLLGSGLFLLGLILLYCLTGQLLFPQLKQAVAQLRGENLYIVPLYLSLLLMALGIGIKSALYPFHTWLPNAYANATPASSAMLSSLISKAYIVLLIKIVFKAAGPDAFLAGGVDDVLFVFSLIGIIMGSVDALREHNLRRMISYSSVAQIGYIFLGVSLGSKAGAAAAVFHIMAHSAAKAMLFLCSDRLVEVSGGSEAYRDLRGSGFRAPLAGLAFMVGAFSIVGVPFLGGFSSKLYLATASLSLTTWKMLTLLLVLAASTLLNVMYFLRTVLTLYRKGERFPLTPVDKRPHPTFAISMAAFIALNLLLGVAAYPIMTLITQGFQMIS